MAFKEEGDNVHDASNQLPEEQVISLVASEHLWSQKMSFNPFPGKAQIERQSNFENLWAIYLWSHTLYDSYCKTLLDTDNQT